MDISLAAVSGWLAVASFVAGACVPLVQRLKLRRRAAPDSRAIGGHMVLGITTAVIALGHTICILPQMGSPAAVAGGTMAIAPGVLASPVRPSRSVGVLGWANLAGAGSASAA